MLRQAVYGVLGKLMLLHAENIDHFDIKPENIFVDEHGRGLLGDHGLARAADEVHTIRGTAGYVAPEF